MSTIPARADVLSYVSDHLATVFDTMLTMKVAPAAECDPNRFVGGRVSGTVGLAGEAVTGSFCLHVSAPFANQITAAMLGMTPEEITGTAEANDVICEVTNMLGGGLKSWLCDSGSACVLSTPAVIRGDAFTITGNHNVELLVVPFDCAAEHGVVEVRLKFN